VYHFIAVSHICFILSHTPKEKERWIQMHLDVMFTDIGFSTFSLRISDTRTLLSELSIGFPFISIYLKTHFGCNLSMYARKKPYSAISGVLIIMTIGKCYDNERRNVHRNSLLVSSLTCAQQMDWI